MPERIQLDFHSEIEFQHLLASIIFHLALLFLLSLKPSPPVPITKDMHVEVELFNSVSNTNLKNKEEKNSESMSETKQMKPEQKNADIAETIATTKSQQEEARLFCDENGKNYFGIGIITDAFSDVVTSAPAMFPGYIAGIRIGDKIAKVKNTDKSTISVTILRNDVEQSYTIKKNKICYKGQ